MIVVLLIYLPFQQFLAHIFYFVLECDGKITVDLLKICLINWQDLDL